MRSKAYKVSEKTFGASLAVRNDEQDYAAIVKTIISRNRILCLTVVVKGAKTRERLEFLHHHHCYLKQGFQFRQPMFFEGIGKLLTKKQRGQRPIP